MFPHQQGFFPFAELQFSRGELLFKYLLSQCAVLSESSEATALSSQLEHQKQQRRQQGHHRRQQQKEASAGAPTAQYRRLFHVNSRKSHRNGEIHEERHKERVKFPLFGPIYFSQSDSYRTIGSPELLVRQLCQSDIAIMFCQSHSYRNIRILQEVPTSGQQRIAFSGTHQQTTAHLWQSCLSHPSLSAFP